MIMTLADLTIETAKQALDVLQERENLSNRTYNHYVQALIAFANCALRRIG